MNWLLVAIIVASTTGKDILQAVAMKRHGEIHDFRPGALGKVLGVLAKNRHDAGDGGRSGVLKVVKGNRSHDHVPGPVPG